MIAQPQQGISPGGCWSENEAAALHGSGSGRKPVWQLILWLCSATAISLSVQADQKADDVSQKVREARQQLESPGAMTPENVRPPLAMIPVCLERGLTADAEKLTDAIGRAAGGWPDSPEAVAIRAELQFRRAQILSHQCQTAAAGKQFEELRQPLVTSRPDLVPELDDELGMIAAWEGRFAEAAEIYSGAVSKRRSLRDDEGLGRSLNLLGAALLTLGRNAEAAASFNEALTIFQRIGDERGAAITHLNRAVLSRAKGELLAAHEELLAVTAFARTHGHRDLEATALGNDAAVLQGAGRYQEALPMAEAALRLQETMENCRALARGHATLGVLHQNTGDTGRADKELNTALELARRYGDRPGELTARNNLGWLAAQLNQPGKAKEIFIALREARRATGDRAGEADALENLGAALLFLKYYEDARNAFNEALVLRRSLSDRKGMGSLLVNLGTCDVKAGKASLAVPRFEEARQIAVAVGAVPLEASAWNNLGVVHKAMGQFKEARNAYEQARLLRAQMGDPVAEAVTLNNLMALSQIEQQPQAAIFYGKQSVMRFQQARTNLVWLPEEAQKSFTAYCQPAYRRLANLLVEAGRLPEAQQVIQMLKVAERFEFLQRDGAAVGAAVTVNLTSAEASLNQQYEDISGRIVALARERTALLARGETQLNQAELKRLRQLDDNWKAARKSFDGFLSQVMEISKRSDRRDEIAAKNLPKTRAMRDLLASLGPDTVLLHYVVGPEKLCVILTTPTVQVGRMVNISEADLNRKVFQFREVLRSGRYEDPQPLARELFDLVLGAVQEDLRQAGAKTLMVSLDGSLRYLPLTVLHDGEHYVVEKYRVALYSETGANRLTERSRSDWSVAAMGLTRKVAPFNALPFVREELGGIVNDQTSATGVLPGIMRLDEQFTLEELKKALSTDQQAVLHIASHFVFNPGTIEDSYLLLGDGHKLTLEEIHAGDLRFGNFDLLTLSACETAVSASRPGNGVEVEGFTSEAQLQGARAILATLWPVNDESTSLLMREFYRLRQANPGWPKAEALRQAQMELLRGGIKPTQSSARRGAILPNEPGIRLADDFSHPYFWAPFVLTGNWQ